MNCFLRNASRDDLRGLSLSPKSVRRDYAFAARCLLAAAALVAICCLPSTRVYAADPPINLNFPASDGMSVTDCLKVISLETGEVLLPDSTVVGAVGAIHTTQTRIEDALNFLKAYEPGLTWQVIYYPAGSNNEPSGEDLYQGIQLLQGLNLDGLLLPPSGDDKIMITFKKQYYTNADQEKQAENGFRAFYLISDPTIRAQQGKSVKPTNTPPSTAADKPAHFLATLSDLQNQLAQMTPPQQVAALNQMYAASRQIMQSVSPQVLSALKSQNNGQRPTAPILPIVTH